MKNPYEVLGLSPDATDTEVKNAYRKLARKYHPDNYADDPEKAAWAEEKMKEINEAYDTIQQQRDHASSSQGKDVFSHIRSLIHAGRYNEADRELNGIHEDERSAEWHYLKSVVLLHRGWVNDAMRELEIACRMDPGNTDYQRAKETFNQSAAGYGSTYYGDAGPRYRSDGCTACDVCQGLICADCCCECMGGDLIRCC